MTEKFSKDIQKYDWLKPLLETYQNIDNFTKDSISKRNLKIACKEKCSACCKNNTIPINQLEAMGISWYASEHIDEPLRSKVIDSLSNYRLHQKACPFLIEESCSIYEARPIICRSFYILNQTCRIGEDVLRARFKDLVQFDRDDNFRSIEPILRSFVDPKRDLREAFEAGVMQDISKPMHTLDWQPIAIAMRAMAKP